MTDLIERVAKTICVSLGVNPHNDITCGVGPVRSPIWGAYIGAAKAAIAEMREPTETMIADAWSVFPSNDDGYTPRDVWDAMIDEALRK